MKKRKLMGCLLGALLRASLIGAMYRWAMERCAPASTPFTWFAEPPRLTGSRRGKMVNSWDPLSLVCEVKVHPPESINKPIPILGNDCYIGSSESRSEVLAAASATREVCVDAGIDLNSQTNTFHVQKSQLDVLLA
ncbi:MAG TPA: hypothetical protein VHR18_10870 [Solirubrobacterales bacterium]|jgi:hypothetical protein|nr:hypothetical protein [Solirubrobacterales bacterium]